jgi:hypothetical protein
VVRLDLRYSLVQALQLFPQRVARRLEALGGHAHLLHLAQLFAALGDKLLDVRQAPRLHFVGSQPPARDQSLKLLPARVHHDPGVRGHGAALELGVLRPRVRPRHVHRGERLMAARLGAVPVHRFHRF